MRPKSPWNSDTHERLRKLWDERIAPTGMSQEEFGALHGIGNQSMVSQYLMGTRPLNYDAALKFAEGFKCTIADICPEMADRLARDFYPVLGVPLPRRSLRRRVAGMLIAAGALALILHNQNRPTAFAVAAVDHITDCMLCVCREEYSCGRILTARSGA